MRLPDARFFLFGMGGRRKLLYGGGVLSDAVTGEIVREWDVAGDRFDPPEYRVEIQPKSSPGVTLAEDESGVWLEEEFVLNDGPGGEVDDLPFVCGKRNSFHWLTDNNGRIVRGIRSDIDDEFLRCHATPTVADDDRHVVLT